MMEVAEKVLTCCHAGCGIVFAVPAWWESTRRKDHTSWYCPNGHGQSFSRESDEEKFRRERDIARQQLARAEDEKREAVAAAERAGRTEIKRLKKRAAAGTCPCCQRSFSNMSEHMKKQHPKFVAESINVIPLKKKRA